MTLVDKEIITMGLIAACMGVIVISIIALYYWWITKKNKNHNRAAVHYPVMFSIGEEVTHIKNGKKYEIVGLPTDYILEGTCEPAYTYLAEDDRIWVRSQEEMEDGRFISTNWHKQKTKMEIIDMRVRDIPVAVERRKSRMPKADNVAGTLPITNGGRGDIVVSSKE